MASWQAAALSRVIALQIKRKPTSRADEAHIVRQARQKLGHMPGYVLPPIPDGLHIRPVAFATLDGDAARGEWLTWKTDYPTATVLYVHGGGYVTCSPQTHRPITVTLATLLRGRVFALDYRLAPEHRFPAALDDAVAAYRWLVETQGVSPNRLIIAGDSAGGGLTVSTLVRLRELGVPLPAGAVLYSPWTDLAGTGDTLETNTERDVMFYGAGIRLAGRIYAGDTPPDHPLVSPLYADLRGLPPLLVFASSSEVLLDDARRLATRAGEAGVSVALHIEADLPHVWPLFCRLIPEGRRTLAQTAAFVRRVINQVPPPASLWSESCHDNRIASRAIVASH
ncbi:MAG: alpha/beta hydrolase [Chloracidobacterium sp.]|uniref:Alpha/beta hydrolase n=1 Tax=Chloracidobacterium validum TaxID=2821543 RepID=A0ABX8BEF7_9BACT|nr:alpha/beta hydrolase [Chloracidobacterium validum]QUW04270.1 alpha/beta hydrolase [Chloracidobacterium validum]